jgi:hypothetical protein
MTIQRRERRGIETQAGDLTPEDVLSFGFGTDRFEVVETSESTRSDEIIVKLKHTRSDHIMYREFARTLVVLVVA